MSAFRTRLAVGALAVCAALAAGCLSDERRANEWVRRASDARASAPLGGEALLQRKLELERAFRDLTHFNTTLDGLQRRRDRNGKLQFTAFVGNYLERQVLPMLEPEWQSRHPEVAVLDADVRLAVAELWFRIGATSRTDQMLDEIERRYAGRGDMIVSYPFGREGTLQDGVERLRDRRWWNG